jgi:hypothetical protein
VTRSPSESMVLSMGFWEEGFREAEQSLRDAPLLPGLESMGGPHGKLRVKVCYSSALFPHFIAPNKSAV